MNDNSSDDQRLSAEVAIIKKTMAELMGNFLAAGFSRQAVLVSLGSLIGNVVGGTVPEEKWPEFFEDMKRPMMKDAKVAKATMEMLKPHMN